MAVKSSSSFKQRVKRIKEIGGKNRRSWSRWTKLFGWLERRRIMPWRYRHTVERRKKNEKTKTPLGSRIYGYSMWFSVPIIIWLIWMQRSRQSGNLYQAEGRVNSLFHATAEFYAFSECSVRDLLEQFISRDKLGEPASSGSSSTLKRRDKLSTQANGTIWGGLRQSRQNRLILVFAGCLVRFTALLHS